MVKKLQVTIQDDEEDFVPKKQHTKNNSKKITKRNKDLKKNTAEIITEKHVESDLNEKVKTIDHAKVTVHS